MDLIYADPPFNSNRDYATFADTWRWDPAAYTDTVAAAAHRPAQVLEVMYTLLGPGPQLAYLVHLVPAWWNCTGCWRARDRCICTAIRP